MCLPNIVLKRVLEKSVREIWRFENKLHHPGRCSFVSCQLQLFRAKHWKWNDGNSNWSPWALATSPNFFGGCTSRNTEASSSFLFFNFFLRESTLHECKWSVDSLRRKHDCKWHCFYSNVITHSAKNNNMEFEKKRIQKMQCSWMILREKAKRTHPSPFVCIDNTLVLDNWQQLIRWRGSYLCCMHSSTKALHNGALH